MEAWRHIPPALAVRVLESVPRSVVLVGGQALSFWLEIYGIGRYLLISVGLKKLA